MDADAVEEAWLSGALSEALAGAHGAWLRGRSAEQAQVVRAIVAQALEQYAAPSARNKEAFHTAWCARANETPDVVTSAWLASTVKHQLSVDADYFGLLRDDYAETKYRALFERVALLRERAWHPTIAASMVELVVAAPYSVGTPNGAETIYGPMLELAVEIGDVSQLPALEELLARPRASRSSIREYLAVALPEAIAQLRRVEVRLKPSQRQAWAALAARTQRPAPSNDHDGPALLEQVWREPDRLEHRLVYADWLTERGDPRGEFIALQVAAASGDQKAARQASALQRQHQSTWLGELDRVLTHVVFERGFLGACALAQNAAATEAVWARACNDPALQTVRRLEKGRGNSQHHAAFACSPMLRNLRALEIPAWPTLDRLLVGPPRRIETLVLLHPPRPEHLTALAKSQALPRLTKLIVVGGDGTLASRLERAKLTHLSLEVVQHHAQARF